MRRATGWIAALVGGLGLAGGLRARDATDATVKTQAEIRGGQSEVFPITGFLRPGQTVRILREADGYLAIVPPPGSSNWIEDRAVRPTSSTAGGHPDLATVLIENTVTRLGSDRSPAPLQYETVKLSRGTIVRLIGDKVFAEGREWWRIQPPPGEVRYVAKAAISQERTTVVASSPGNTPQPSAVPGQPTNKLWLEAQQAEQAHDYAKAELLYRQLAGEMSQPNGDHDLAMRCYNRIEQLSRAQTTNWPARQPAPGMLVSGNARPPATPAPPPGSVASGPGWLRSSGIIIDGKRAYALEDYSRQVKYYLVAQPGLNMEQFLNRNVEVFGNVSQRADVPGGGYMSVNLLHLLR
jgi:hypothetical protein